MEDNIKIGVKSIGRARTTLTLIQRNVIGKQIILFTIAASSGVLLKPLSRYTTIKITVQE
jgi:hypothetical protein